MIGTLDLVISGICYLAIVFLGAMIGGLLPPYGDNPVSRYNHSYQKWYVQNLLRPFRFTPLFWVAMLVLVLPIGYYLNKVGLIKTSVCVVALTYVSALLINIVLRMDAKHPES